MVLQFDEQREQANVERVLRAIFLDPDRPSSVSFAYAIFSSLFSLTIMSHISWE